MYRVKYGEITREGESQRDDCTCLQDGNEKEEES